MKQFLPDWTVIVSKTDLEAKYQFTFTYKKPGLYLTNTDTVFIQENESGHLHVHVFNCPLRELVIAETIPTQYDGRK